MPDYTPGPWTIEHTTLDIVRLLVTPEEVGAWEISAEQNPNRAIAYVPSDYAPEQQAANARLIATAPDLLEACYFMRDFYHMDTQEFVAKWGHGHTTKSVGDKARAAIARVEKDDA